MVVLHGGVLVDDAVHRGHVDVVFDDGGLVQELDHVVLELAAQEVLDRQAVALLAAIDNVVRQHALQRRAEDVLGAHALQLPVAGQAGHVFDEDVIEQGHADFQRTGHAHLVHLHQDAVGHLVAHIQIDLPVDLVGGVAGIEIAAQHAEGVEIDRVFEAIVEEGGVLFGIGEVLPADMVPLGGQVGALDEALEHVDGALLLGLVGQQADHGADDSLAQKSGDGRVVAVELAGLETVVAGKALVATLATEADGDMLACLLAEQVERHGREVGHRFIQMPEGLFDVVGVEVVDHQHLVIRVEIVGDLLGVLELAEALVLVADGEGA